MEYDGLILVDSYRTLALNTVLYLLEGEYPLSFGTTNTCGDAYKSYWKE